MKSFEQKKDKSDFNNSVMNWGTPENLEWMEENCTPEGTPCLPEWTDKQLIDYQNLTRSI